MVWTFLDKKRVVLVLLLVWIVAGCQYMAEEAPTATPTATRTPVPPRPQNDNVTALNSAQAAVGEFHFGLAPQLEANTTRITVETSPNGEMARMVYERQPDDPTEWMGVDSFVLAYAVRETLASSSAVRRVMLGQFHVSASVGQEAFPVQHYAAWINFADGSQAIVDLSPLATNFAPRHLPEMMLTDPVEIEETYRQRQETTNLNQLQPLLVEEQNGQSYYLLAEIKISYHQYAFTLQLHPIQPADPMRPLELHPGVSAGVEIDRTDFAKLQTLVRQGGPEVFDAHPELLTRRGADNELLTELINEQLHLLWHLITKFEHTPPDPSRPTPTPVPTATPLPTPTPTPTATPRKLPLVTS
jgi:hypothetical protein